MKHPSGFQENQPIKRALLSVTDKQGLDKFAQGLQDYGVEILSTGGTATLLKDLIQGVQEISDYTGFPEMMGGRVKSLHPLVHGAILARPGIDDKDLATHGIKPLDMVVGNLYILPKEPPKEQSDYDSLVEQIDIGGPAMLRAAAKNHQHVCVVVDVNDYPMILEELQHNQGCISFATRQRLALKAYQLTSAYDARVAELLQGALLQKKQTSKNNSFPDTLGANFQQVRTLRYGENPHQQAAVYSTTKPNAGSIVTAKQHQGKELSFNNFADADVAYGCVSGLSAPSCVVVKHANPAGVACAQRLDQALENAWDCDPVSSFGGVIAFNRELDEITSEKLLDKGFFEVVVAPSVCEAALEKFHKRKNLRVLTATTLQSKEQRQWDVQGLYGGLLLQTMDTQQTLEQQWRKVTQQTVDAVLQQELHFAWQVVRYVRSNAIVLSRDQQTIGIGAGQPNRVDSVELAIYKAKRQGFEVQGAVLASDAFFPFRDSVDKAIEAGISAIVQPGGSMRDEESIQAANEGGIPMLFTGQRCFKH